MKIQRWYQVLFILIPLVFALPLLLFSIFTEFWLYTDNLILDKNQKQIEYNLNPIFIKRKHQIKFYKLKNLFSSCYDYKWINLIEPSNKNKSEPNECLKQDKCLHIPCFCCTTNQGCCIDATKKCNFVPDCLDESDEINTNHECSAIQFGYYKIKYYDKINMCYREKYDYASYIKNLLKNNFNFNHTGTLFDDYSELEEINLSLLTLFFLLTSALFTIICFFTILFIRCCSYKTESTLSAKSEYYDNFNKRNNYITNNLQNVNDTNDENDDDDDDSDYTTPRLSICKCTYYLCPFIFYTIFSSFAFFSCLSALSIYIYSNYLNYKNNYFNNQLYHLNTWLYDLNRCGFSFYTLCASCFFYGLTFLLSLYTTCRIQISPEWKSRYSETYEILQMNDIEPSTSKSNKKKNIYKN